VEAGLLFGAADDEGRSLGMRLQELHERVGPPVLVPGVVQVRQARVVHVDAGVAAGAERFEHGRLADARHAGDEDVVHGAIVGRSVLTSGRRTRTLSRT
jgi:hypothetical protein